MYVPGAWPRHDLTQNAKSDPGGDNPVSADRLAGARLRYLGSLTRGAVRPYPAAPDDRSPLRAPDAAEIRETNLVSTDPKILSLLRLTAAPTE
jgi:hypothetical protein